MSDPPGERSPWERDDWMPPAVPRAEFDRHLHASPGGDRSVGADTPRPPRRVDPLPTSARTVPRRRIAGFAAVAIVATAAIVLALRPDGDRSAEMSTGTEHPLTSTPANPVGGSDGGPASTPTGPSTRVTVPPTSPPVETLPDVGSRFVVAATADGSLPDLETVAVGETPIWTEWSVTVPPGLDALAVPTEVVVLSTGVVHRVEFPSGRARSVAVMERWDPAAELAVAGDTIAVTSYRDVILIRDDARVIRTSVGEGIAGILARPSHGDFLVTARRSSSADRERQWLLAADGTLTDLAGSEVTNFASWDQRILPSGELVANGPGGVYAIDFAGGARRIDDGQLVATGVNHYAVNRCDDALRCTYVVVDARTGETTPAALESLGVYLYFDTSMRISPDGRFIHYADWQRPQAIWRLIDVATGVSIDLDATAQIRLGDSWAADSSGVLSGSDGVLVYNTIEGTVVGISGFGPIRAVVTRPVASPG